ncbi:hypothetical protein Sbal223_3661 [Shewanella baltica OS223]|nr:hypothetical protein Sbal223_3661 [Shewanella baltica OS223]
MLLFYKKIFVSIWDIGFAHQLDTQLCEYRL